jgi:hypothetical protein
MNKQDQKLISEAYKNISRNNNGGGSVRDCFGYNLSIGDCVIMLTTDGYDECKVVKIDTARKLLKVSGPGEDENNIAIVPANEVGFFDDNNDDDESPERIGDELKLRGYKRREYKQQ